jgi:hypothetical protein
VLNDGSRLEDSDGDDDDEEEEDTVGDLPFLKDEPLVAKDTCVKSSLRQQLSPMSSSKRSSSPITTTLCSAQAEVGNNGKQKAASRKSARKTLQELRDITKNSFTMSGPTFKRGMVQQMRTSKLRPCWKQCRLEVTKNSCKLLKLQMAGIKDLGFDGASSKTQLSQTRGSHACRTFDFQSEYDRELEDAEFERRGQHRVAKIYESINLKEVTHVEAVKHEDIDFYMQVLGHSRAKRFFARPTTPLETDNIWGDSSGITPSSKDQPLHNSTSAWYRFRIVYKVEDKTAMLLLQVLL